MSTMLDAAVLPDYTHDPGQLLLMEMNHPYRRLGIPSIHQASFSTSVSPSSFRTRSCFAFISVPKHGAKNIVPVKDRWTVRTATMIQSRTTHAVKTCHTKFAVSRGCWKYHT